MTEQKHRIDPPPPRGAARMDGLARLAPISRFLGQVLVGLVLTLMTLWLVAYFWLGSTPGRASLVAAIGSASPGLEVGVVRWGPAPGSLTVGGLGLRDPEGKRLIALRLARADLELLPLLTGDLVVDRLQLELSHVIANIDREGRVDLLMALSPPRPEPSTTAASRPRGIRPTISIGELDLRVDQLHLVTPDAEIFVVNGIHALGRLVLGSSTAIDGRLTLTTLEATWDGWRRHYGVERLLVEVRLDGDVLHLPRIEATRAGEPIALAALRVARDGTIRVRADAALSAVDTHALVPGLFPFGFELAGLELEITPPRPEPIPRVAEPAPDGLAPPASDEDPASSPDVPMGGRPPPWMETPMGPSAVSLGPAPPSAGASSGAPAAPAAALRGPSLPFPTDEDQARPLRITGSLAQIRAPLWVSPAFTASQVELALDALEVEVKRLVPRFDVQLGHLHAAYVSTLGWELHGLDLPGGRVTFQRRLDVLLGPGHVADWRLGEGHSGADPVAAELVIAADLGLTGGPLHARLLGDFGHIDAVGRLRISPLSGRTSFSTTLRFADLSGPPLEALLHDLEPERVALVRSSSRPSGRAVFELAVSRDRGADGTARLVPAVTWDEGRIDLPSGPSFFWDGYGWDEGPATTPNPIPGDDAGDPDDAQPPGDSP